MFHRHPLLHHKVRELWIFHLVDITWPHDNAVRKNVASRYSQDSSHIHLHHCQPTSSSAFPLFLLFQIRLGPTTFHIYTLSHWIHHLYSAETPSAAFIPDIFTSSSCFVHMSYSLFPLFHPVYLPWFLIQTDLATTYLPVDGVCVLFDEGFPHVVAIPFDPF